MDKDPLSDEEAKALVETMLEHLLSVANTHAGGDLAERVKDWWRSHYRGNFFYAIRFKGRTYEKDRVTLENKAQELGETARRLAGVEAITTLHAALASYEVDCPPIDKFEDWCN